MIRHIAQDQLDRAHENIAESVGHKGAISRAGGEGGTTRQHEGALDALRLFSEFLSYAPGYEELLRSYVRNFTRRGTPKSRPMNAMTLELALSPVQCEHGGTLPLRVPVFDVCGQCEGTGRSGFFTCDRCVGRGMMEHYHRIDVVIPAKLKDEIVVPVSLRHMGVSDTYLNVRLRPTGVGPA